jgi:preprotein translocase subunit SecY
LQKEEGELGRQQISKYTRYLTCFWAILLSSVIAVFLIRPIAFDWGLGLYLKVVLSLTVGSILSMWFSELITEEGLGNGSSMVIFINIVGAIPNNINSAVQSTFQNFSIIEILSKVTQGLLVYFLIVFIVIIFQDSYKKIELISAKQSNLGFNEKQSNSFIPLKLNQGGIMPLVFSSTIAVLLIIPFQFLLNQVAATKLTFLSSLLPIYSFGINLILVVFFSCFYVSLVLKPKDMSENLGKMAYSIPGIKQGKETTKYLEKIITRLSFIGGLFLAFLAFFPILLNSFIKFTVFKNLTSLLILIGVITDTTSQIQGYLVSTRYDFKNM